MRGVKLDISEQLEGWTLVCNNRITWQTNQARYKLDLCLMPTGKRKLMCGYFLMSFIYQHELTTEVCHLKDRIWSAHI